MRRQTAFAALVRAYLAESGQTQTELALKLGIDQRWISHWLRGRRPSPELAIRFAVRAGLDHREVLKAAGYWPVDVPVVTDRPGESEPTDGAAELATVLREHPDVPRQRRFTPTRVGTTMP